jgi:hypothetical protein
MLLVLTEVDGSMAPFEELDDSTRRTRKLAQGWFVVKLFDSILQTLRVHIYTLVLTWLLVGHDYNIYCLKLIPRRQCPSRTRHQFVPSLYLSHVIMHSRTLPPPSVKQLFCRMMTYSRPQTPLPNALKKNLLPNGAFSTKLGPQVSLFPIPSMRVLYSHMYVQHVFLVGFVVIVVISLTVWMLRYRCGYTWKCLITLRSDSTVEGKGLAAA